MKYSIDQVIDLYHSQKPIDYLFFWGHKTHDKSVISKACMSQWWEAPFEKNGFYYPTAEHWMMAEKARLFEDVNSLEKIMKAKNPGEAKHWGRQVKHFDQQIWEAQRGTIVVEGNYLKFTQHIDLQDFLLATKNKMLVEASPVDFIWGVGLAASDNRIYRPTEWRGLNLLGFALMEVRDQLIQ